MNLYRLATEGIDLDALPLEESQQPRASFQFESSARTPDRLRLPGELDDVFNFAAQEYGVDVDVLRGIAYAESRFNPDIISGKVKSPVGAIGLMQFMPETAKEYGIDPTDPVQSIIGGAAYLRNSLDKFGGDYERAVASYNWGPNRKAYDYEDWASKAPAETQKYLMTVFDAAGRFKDGAAERSLPAGVEPSKAGAGRGVVSPGMVNTKELTQRPQDALPIADTGALGSTASAINTGLAKGVAKTGAGLGTFLQDPGGSIVSGLTGAGALLDRGVSSVLSAVGIPTVPNEQVQRNAQIAAESAQQRRGERYEDGNPLAIAGRFMEDDSRRVVRELQNQERQQNPRLVAQQKAMYEAEGFVGNLKAAVQNPIALTNTLAESAFPMAAGVGAASLATRMGGGVGAVSATGTASEAGFAAMNARESVYQTVADMPVEKLAKSPRFQEILQSVKDPMAARELLANELADQAPLLTAAGTAGGTLLTNRLFGGDATAKSIVGAGRMTGKEFASRVAQETVEEVAQGVPEDLVQYGTLKQADTERKLDLAGSAAQNMVGGFAFGVGGHGLAYGRDAVFAPRVENQPTTPQAPTVTPQAPVTPDAAKTQAVDNIAAAIQEVEGAATQTAPVQPGSQAVDAGAGFGILNRAKAPAAATIAANTLTGSNLAGMLGRSSDPLLSGISDRRVAAENDAQRRAGEISSLGSQKTDILNPSGQPFKTKFAAELAAKKTPGEVVEVPGGYAVRAEQTTPATKKQQEQPPAQQPILNNGKPFTLAEVGKANQAIGGTAVSVPGGWAIQPPATAQQPAATPATAMPPAATPAASAQSAILGRNSQPIAEGGQPFATREEAKAEKRMQPLMRVAPAEGGGFILKPASERQLAAVEKAAKRLKYPSTGETGPRSLHGFILQIGGLASGAMPDVGFDLNPRVGNRRLFSPRGKTIEQAAMAAKQEGYIQDEDENTLIEALKRSLNVSPVYTPDGYEAMAEAQMQARYEDFLAAEQDGGAENDWSHLTPEELADTGYNDYDEAAQAEIRALVAQAEALGIDAESILEDVAQRTENATQKDYENAAKSAIEAAIRSSEESRSRDLGQASAEAGPATADTQAAPAAVNQQATPAPEVGPTNQGSTNGQGQETLLKAGQPTGAAAMVSGAPVAENPSDTTKPGGFIEQAKKAAGKVDAAPAQPILTSPTKADIEAKQARAEQAAKAKAAQDKADAARAAKERERKEVAATSVAAADTFELGQDAMANLTGQNDLQFSRAAAKEVRDLVTLHNLSEDNLMYAGKMGGIPVPSIGITKVETPFGGFGEITLIAPKDLIDPEAGVPVYDRDAWTARFPTLNFKKIKAKVADAFYERMSAARDLGGDGGQFMSSLFDELRNARVQSPDKITSLFTQYSAPKMLYAQEALGKIIKPQMRGIKPETPFGHTKAWRDFVAKSDMRNMTEQREREFNREAAVAARAAMAEIGEARKEGVDERTARMLDSSLKSYLDRYITEDGMNAGILDRALRDVKSFGQKEIDPMKMDEAVRKVVPLDDAGYKKWVAGLIEPLFEAPTITVRGSEVPVTLENVVEAMTIGKTAGAEKSMTFGAGKAASMLGKQFKSIDEIKAARDQVVSAASEKEGKKSTEALISEYQNHVSAFYTGKDWKGNIDTWAALDSSLEALTKAGRNPTDGAMNIALQRSGFKRVDAKGISLAKQALEALRDATTDYFEAKPQRAVRLNEFKGAVVPKGTSAEAIALLEENGITVEVHGNAEGAREKAIQKLAKKLDGKTGSVIFSRDTESPRTPAATIRAAITKAYGNLLDKLEGKGLVTIAQTEREAIEAAAQARADKTGGDVEHIKRSMLASVQMQRVWHGSPHRGIQQFSTDKIGTGEGAQAYGWGLYYASKQEIAEDYRKKLSGGADQSPRRFFMGQEFQPGTGGYFAARIVESSTLAKARKDVSEWIKDAETWSDRRKADKGEQETLRVWIDALAILKQADSKSDFTKKAAQGQLYEVEIPEDGDMLLWDKPLSEQPENVLAALRRGYEEQGGDYPDKSATPKTGREIYNDFRALAGGFESMDQRAASEYLASLGIKGIKYLDGTSRNAGDGSYNYVIFDGADTQIVDVKYSANGNIEGFFDRQTGKSFLVADNLTSASAPGTLMHEVGIHMAADGKLEPLFDRAANLLKMGKGNAFIDRVQNRLDEAGETSAEEAAAYIVTEYEKDRTNAPASVTQWIKDFIADVRAWLFSKGVLLKADSLTVADIAAVARANARIIADGKGWTGYAQKDGAFRFGNTEGQRSKDIATVAEAFSSDRIKLVGVELDGGSYQVYLDGAPDQSMTVYPTAGGKWRINAQDANRGIDRTGDNAGQRMYQALFAWAHNNGHTVDAEFSLSYPNELRRTAAMLSSALRFGSTEHLGEPDEMQGINGWKEGGFASDVQALADAELRKVQERILALGDFTIEPNTGVVYVDQSSSGMAAILLQRDQSSSVDTGLALQQQGGVSGENSRGNAVGMGGYGNEERQGNTRRDNWSSQSDVVGRTGNSQSVSVPLAAYEKSPVSDSELARYLASTRGGFESHGVGVSTLKRALITRDHGGSSDLPGLLYSVDGKGDIRRSVAPKQPVQQTPAVTTWDDLGASKMDALIFEGQDDRIDLKRVQENIVKAGRQIREEFDARMAETLFPGRVAKRNESFVDQEVKPLLQAMAASNVSMEELGDYLLARHAPERNAQIAKVNPGMPDGGAGTNSQGVLMTTQAANDYIVNLSAGKRTALQLLAKRVDAITSGTRDILVTEGLEKASTVAAWEGAYKNYVPLFKDEAAETPGHPVGSGFSVKGGASKRAMGSTKEVTNVLAHVLMQREAAITRAEKNRVGMSLYGLALSNPNKEFWGTVVPKMSTPEIMAELQNMGVNVADAFAGMEATPTIRYVDPNTGLVTERPNPVYKNLDNALVVKVNGEDRVILFNKKNDRAMRLAESLKNQNRGWGSAAPALDAVGKVTRFMASMLTQYNPAFGMVNSVRDVQGALVNLSSTPIKGQQAKVLAAVPAAMKGIARDLRGDKARTQWSDLWVQFQDDGGRTGIRDLISDPYEKAGQVEKDLMRLSKSGKLTPGNAAHAVLDLLSDFNDTLENGVRLAAYKTAIDQGMSRPAAAKLARELTVDFNRKGRTGRELGKLYAFLNASIQGSARTIQTLKGPMGAKIMAGGFALGVLQAFMLAAAGFDDDDIPEFIKSRNLIIPMGGDRYVTIPMALGLHVLPNTGRAVTELVMSGGKDIGEKSLNTIVEIVTAFNPFGGGGDWKTAHGPLTMITPTVMDPVIDLAMNRDFTGRQISKERFGKNNMDPGAKLARESTKQSPSGQVYIGISEAINTATGGTDVTKGAVSPTPEQLRYLATVVGGGVYRETERAINAAVLLARGEEVKPHQVPLGSRFAGVLDDEMSTMSRYYKNNDQLGKFWDEFKKEASAGNTSRVEEMKRDPRFAAAAMNNKIYRAIADVSSLASENTANKEKYEALNKKRAELMKKVNEAVKEAEKQ